MKVFRGKEKVVSKGIYKNSKVLGSLNKFKLKNTIFRNLKLKSEHFFIILEDEEYQLLLDFYQLNLNAI